MAYNAHVEKAMAVKAGHLSQELEKHLRLAHHHLDEKDVEMLWAVVRCLFAYRRRVMQA